MYKVLILLFILICNTLQSANYMMSCVSSDFKEMAFYKFQKRTNGNNSTLLARPMKTRWQDFCASSFNNEVSCIFTDLLIKRVSTKKKNDHSMLNSIYLLDFEKYSLNKKIIYIKNNEKDTTEKLINYKCRKIKI